MPLLKCAHRAQTDGTVCSCSTVSSLMESLHLSMLQTFFLCHEARMMWIAHVPGKNDQHCLNIERKKDCQEIAGAVAATPGRFHSLTTSRSLLNHLSPPISPQLSLPQYWLYPAHPRYACLFIKMNAVHRLASTPGHFRVEAKCR